MSGLPCSRVSEVRTGELPRSLRPGRPSTSSTLGDNEFRVLLSRANSGEFMN